MTSFLFSTPAGVPGDITRQQYTIVESGLLNQAKVPTAFGAPVKLVLGRFEAIEAADTAADFAGILSRLAPSIGGAIDGVFGPGTPNPDATQGIIVKGYCNVRCAIGTPVRGAPVYMRVVPDTGKLVGDLEATADGVNNVLLPGVTWAVDGADADKTAEIRFL